MTKTTYAVYSPKTSGYAYLDMGKVAVGTLPRNSSIGKNLKDAQKMCDGYNKRLDTAVIKAASVPGKLWARKNNKAFGKLIVVAITLKAV